MKNTFKITLKPGEKIYVNGAVIKGERKTTLEFLNDVQFLLENHVLQALILLDSLGIVLVATAL